MSNADGGPAPELYAETRKEQRFASRVADALGGAIDAASMAPNVRSLSDRPDEMQEAKAAFSLAIAKDPQARAAVDATGRVVTWNAVVGLVNSLFLVYTTIRLQLPLDPGQYFQIEPVMSAIGSAGTALIPFVRRFWPSIASFFPGATTTSAIMLGLMALSVFFLLVPSDVAYAGVADAFERTPILWAIPAIGVGIPAAWLVSRLFGVKMGLFAFIGVVAVGAVRIFVGRQRLAGRREAEAEQQRRHDDEVRTASEAIADERAERDRLAAEGKDPAPRPWHVDRRTGRVPDDGGA